jgi:hypothetical protein
MKFTKNDQETISERFFRPDLFRKLAIFGQESGEEDTFSTPTRVEPVF